MLTDNPRLMLLEQYAGQEQSNYRSFFIIEQNKASRSDSILAISRMLGRQTHRDSFSDLFKQQRIQVSSAGAIRFFSERNGSQYTEYIPDTAGRYKQNRTGANDAFLSRIKNAREIELYSSPKSLLIHRPDAFARKAGKHDGILALLEPNIETVHRAVAAQPQLKHISLIEAHGTEANPDVLKFFDDLKQSLNPFSIDITLAWEPASRSQTPRDTAREVGLGLSREMSFTQGGR